MRLVLCLILILAAALPRPAAAQDGDSGVLARFLQDRLSAAGREVRVTGFRGALSSLAEIERITVADDEGIWLTLNGVALDWNRAALLRGRVSVNRLTAEEIVVARRPVAAAGAPPSPEARGFALPDLPVSVSIGRLAAARVELGAPVLGEPLTGSVEAALTLAGGEGETDLRLTRTDAGPPVTLTLQASYANASRNLVLNLDAREAAGGIVARRLGLPGAPATDLTVAGQGLIDDFTADLRLATDGTDRLTGTLRLSTAPDGGQAFAASLGGNPAPLFLSDYAEFFGTDVALDVAGVRAATGAFDLSRLTVRTEAMEIDGALRLASDLLPEEARLTGRIGHADGRPVLLPAAGAGRTLIDRADITLGFDATAEEGWTAMVTLSGLDHPEIRIGRALLSGSGRISRQGQGNLVGGTFRLLAADLSPTDPAMAQALGTGLTATARLVWQEGRALDLSDLMLAGGDFTLTARGEVDGLASGLRVRGQAGLDARDLSRFAGLAGRPVGGAATIEARGSGSRLGGDFDVTASVAGDGLRIGQAEADNLLKGQTRLIVSAARGSGGTEIRQLDLTAASLSISARGQLRTAGSDLTADLDFADLGVLGPAWGGRLVAQAAISGTPEAGRLTLEGTGTALTLGQPVADGLLGGTSTLAVALRSDQGAVIVDRATLSNPQLAADVAGRVEGARAELSGDLALRDLSLIGPGFGGSLTARAQLSGTMEAGSLTLEGTGQDLAVGQPLASGLLRGSTTLSLALRSDRGAVLVDRATLSNAQGSADVTGRVQTAGSDLSGTVALRDLGALGPGYGGSVTATGRVTGTARTGTLTLDATARGLSVGQVEADRLLAGNSTLALALRTENGAVRVDRAQLVSPELTVNATGQAEGTTRRVALDARLANLALLLPEFPGALTLNGTATDDGRGYQIDLTGQGPGQIDARATGRVASNLSSADLVLAGTAQAALANAFIAPQSVEGPLRFDLRLNGPLTLRSLSGRVALSNGRVALPALPFSLQAVDALAEIAAGTARLSATAGVSSGGSIALRGPVALDPPFTGDLTLDLNDVIVRDPDLYEVLAQGRLRISGPLAGGATISGMINIPDAELRVPSSGLGGAGAIPEIRHVNEPGPVRQTRARAGLIQSDRDRQGRGLSRPYVLDVRINAPNRIFLRGRGLDAELGGLLLLRGTSVAVVPSGEIRLIRGRLDILGRRLDLSEAEIALGGSLDATLRIVASNTSDGITSSVVIEGPVSDPTVSFTSVPSLPDEEVLARLLFGRDLSSLSAFQATQLAGAVATLAGQGGEGLIAQIRKSFGLDDLDIVSDGDGDASLRIGRYIADNVYTDLVVGSNGTSELTLNLDIRPGVTVRAIAGSDGQTGIGIYVDRDY
jgi:translocation and assembly module TamB